MVQAFLKKWWVESDIEAPNLPLSVNQSKATKETLTTYIFLILCNSCMKETKRQDCPQFPTETVFYSPHSCFGRLKTAVSKYLILIPLLLCFILPIDNCCFQPLIYCSTSWRQLVFSRIRRISKTSYTSIGNSLWRVAPDSRYIRPCQSQSECSIWILFTTTNNILYLNEIRLKHVASICDELLE